MAAPDAGCAAERALSCASPVDWVARPCSEIPMLLQTVFHFVLSPPATIAAEGGIFFFSVSRLKLLE